MKKRNLKLYALIQIVVLIKGWSLEINFDQDDLLPSGGQRAEARASGSGADGKGCLQPQKYQTKEDTRAQETFRGGGDSSV
ncbi:uncharacterized protein P174DRAFT_415897 [Aspergillus novofumigatus IBT 16806]|uniref:Uncharacterized protein n=1 Tax=Aspergillus novofumigatus (strain IBT 16806) TaxID=1392255 RepID=A0A2I1CKI6_ASPN1|nr:uncharacterized protein P174DRAFT_415897 [Aspergillus novofumigatus IBT 16806]PKX98136.1 hypothetical protein P174DRAFT_415897 [Aspergillus novofumigatus IBT 16806]